MSNGRCDEPWIGDRRQRDKKYAIVKMLDHLSGNLQRQPSLATATRSRQRQEALIRKQLLDLANLSGAPDETVKLNRQIIWGYIQRLERREISGQILCNHLEDMLDALKVLQAVFTQIPQGDIF